MFNKMLALLKSKFADDSLLKKGSAVNNELRSYDGELFSSIFFVVVYFVLLICLTDFNSFQTLHQPIIPPLLLLSHLLLLFPLELLFRQPRLNGEVENTVSNWLFSSIPMDTNGDCYHQGRLTIFIRRTESTRFYKNTSSNIALQLSLIYLYRINNMFKLLLFKISLSLFSLSLFIII